ETEAAGALETQRQAVGERATLVAAAAERRRQRDQVAAWLNAMRVEQDRGRQHQGSLGADRERLLREHSDVERNLEQLQSTRAAAVQVQGAAEANLTRLTSLTAGLDHAAADEGRRLAGLEERLRGERRREVSLRAQERALSEELTLRAERTALLQREQEATAG